MRSSLPKSAAILLSIVLGLLHGNPVKAQTTDVTSSVEATLSDFAWLAGHWQGNLAGRIVEEIWSEPMVGLMMGMFRLADSTQTLVLEFFSLRQSEEGIEFRLRHFSPALDAWEKEDPITLKLVNQRENLFTFENPFHDRPKRVILTRAGENTLISRSEIIREDKTEIMELTLSRVE